MATGFQPFGGNWTHLGSTVLATAQATTDVVEFQPMDLLHVSYMVTGYGGSGIVSIRFNGDTGNNYSDRHAYINATGITAGTDASVSAVGNIHNIVNTSTNLIRLAATAVVVGRSGWMHIMNNKTTSKLCSIINYTSSGAVATIPPTIELVAGGEWFNTTTQITSITMTTNNGVTLTAGSGFAVFGSNLS